MNIDVSSLPVRDFMDMGLPLMALQLSRCPEPEYHVCFRLRMLNASPVSIRLLGRKWLLKDDSGDTRIVEGAQVFNQNPVLAPGAVYSYGGCHTFHRRPVRMEVSFFGSDQFSKPFITPPFIFPRQCFNIPRR